MKTDIKAKARRDGLREAQTWLFARAKQMDDPKAQDILNAAAFEFGVVKLQGLRVGIPNGEQQSEEGQIDGS